MLENINVFIVDVDSNESLQFQYMPRELNLSSTANLPEIAIIGRNIPDFEYVGGKRSISFALEFFAFDAQGEDAIRRARWLESLRMSDNGGGPVLANSKGLSRVQLIWGKLFQDVLFVVADVNVKYDLFTQAYDWMPRQAVVNLTLHQVSDTPYTKSLNRNF